MNCDPIAGDDRLLALSEGLLDDGEAREVGAHVAGCAACTARGEEVLEEGEALAEGISRWMASLPEVGLPDAPVRRRPSRWLYAAAAASFLLAWIAFGWDRGARTLEIEVAPAPAMGCIPPPSMAQMMFLTNRIVEVKIDRIEEGSIHVAPSDVAVLRGPERAFPGGLELVVPAGMSELGPTPVKAAPGEKLLLLFAKEDDEGLRLVTRDAHSTMSAKGLLYLETADLHKVSYEARRAQVLGAFDLAARLRKLPWEEQEAPLSAALRGDNAIAREAALAWYSHQRSGFPSHDLSLLEENRDLKPPLPAVEKELRALLLPREGALSTLVGVAARLLDLNGAEHWIDRLGAGEEGEVAFLVLWSCWNSPESALEKADRPGDPVFSYLRAALLAKWDDSARLAWVFRTQLAPEVPRALSSWKHAPVWPPLRLAGAVADREFADEAEALAWLERNR